MRYLTCALLFVVTACAAPPNTLPSPPPAASTQNNAAVSTSAPTPTRVSNNPSPAQSTEPPLLVANVTATPRPSDQPTATPFVVPTAQPTRTPGTAQFTQLMQGGCCVNPSWLPDSASIVFIDKPNSDAPTGLYQIKIDAPNVSSLWREGIALYSSDFEYAQIPEQAGTRIVRASDGQAWRINNRGRTVQISPDRTRVVWTETRETFPIENRVSNIMLANIDGSEPKRVVQVLRGGVSGWLDNNRLLLNGRASRETNDSTIFVYDLRDGARTELVSAERIRLTALSREGSWLAYAITNDKDAARNGLWVTRTDGTAARKLDFFGPLQWRDDNRFVYVPFESETLEGDAKQSHAFFEYDVETNTSRMLTPPGIPFTIASGDWALSPDGKKIVLVNAADNNLWLWRFP